MIDRGVSPTAAPNRGIFAIMTPARFNAGLSGASLLCLALCAGPALADDVGKVFTLGQVTATAPTEDGTALGGSTITSDDMRMFNRESLDKAITLVPGASANLVGNRNESDVWIRGFDRWRVPLAVDGIPVYLPYDNRVDFSRFTTSDISEIQVTKGFTSVIDGPGAMGGSINLVSRQVTKPFEGDARVGTSFDQNGAFNGVTTDVFAGTKQSDWYIQGSGSETDQTHWRLSDDYTPGTLENGGNRDHSGTLDYKINLKAGYTPTATDEYSINIIDQNGNKDTPFADTKIAPASAKYWTWPDWDKQSVYWLSKTAIDDAGSFVKVRAYYDRFYNVLDIWDNANFNSMSSTSAEISTYDDRAAGGSAEVDKVLFGGADTVRAAFHFRWDQHNSHELTNANPGQWYAIPWLEDDENTYSVALENVYHPTRAWDVTAGVSYDYRQMLKADDWDSLSAVKGVVPAPFGYLVNYPLSDKRAVDPELAVAYHFDDAGVVHASVTERTRFPTLFEMFSSRFGTFTGNPYLQPEKTVNWDTGVADTFGHTRLGADIFYDHMMNAVEAVSVYFPTLGKSTNQYQNVGTEDHEGFELEASSQVLETLQLGANYSYLMRQILNHVAVATETPRHRIFAYANWQPIEGLSVVPSVDVNGKRWLQSAASTSIYLKGGDAAVANIKVSYDITPAMQIEAGVNNLFDTNYEIEDGYHAQGRNLFTNLRVKF